MENQSAVEPLADSMMIAVWERLHGKKRNTLKGPAGSDPRDIFKVMKMSLRELDNRRIQAEKFNTNQ